VGVRDVVRGFPGSPEVHVIPVSPWGKYVHRKGKPCHLNGIVAVRGSLGKRWPL
jgi:hypothetical protein